MTIKEGSLEAPRREPIDWQDADFHDRDAVDAELARVFDVCHGCRRCVNLCEAFPTLFDLIDESDTMEVDGVDRGDYGKVVEQCYLCDLCAETKCPYLPPHEWRIDFPHLMLRAKATRFKEQRPRWRDRLITSTGLTFSTLSAPGVRQLANGAAKLSVIRGLGERLAGIHRDAPLPTFHGRRRRAAARQPLDEPVAGERTSGRVAVYATCYGEHNDPQVVEDLLCVLRHNGIDAKRLDDATCCAMPKLELGDLDGVAANKDANLPVFLAAIDDGYDLMSIIPSCVLMYRQEIPLLFPDDEDVARVKTAFFDPFEYLVARRRDGLANLDFKHPLGKVAYHAACHQRVQAIGQRTREFLALVPDTEVTMIERCSGHDGTYAVKAETYDKAMKIARPVVRMVRDADADTYGSDCPMAGRMIEHGLDDGTAATHPISMLRRAYGI
ncbi:MAG: Fe-S oxidoreductase [Gammaproteobacteria bacterium]|nr:Fe-S oxidoreductase [Gammaproteobacteria bacterium]